MSEYVKETKFKLDEARFFYEQMKLNLQDRTLFLYFLDAFLSAARAVTWVFQNASGKIEDSILEWYDSKVIEWNKDAIMRFFIETRNISVKEHAPKMRTTAAVSFSGNTSIRDSFAVEKISPDGSVQQVRSSLPKATEETKEKQETAHKKPTIIRYSFNELPIGFSEDPDVVTLCRRYLDMLEAFVTEAESRAFAVK